MKNSLSGARRDAVAADAESEAAGSSATRYREEDESTEGTEEELHEGGHRPPSAGTRQQMPSPRPWKMIRYFHSTVRILVD